MVMLCGYGIGARSRSRYVACVMYLLFVWEKQSTEMSSQNVHIINVPGLNKRLMFQKKTNILYHIGRKVRK